MYKLFLTSLKLLILFGRNSIGCINSPYITYRRLAEEKTDVRQSVYIFGLALGYFAFTVFVRSGIRNPYLLTMKYNSLFLGGAAAFFLMVLFLFLSGKVFKKQTRLPALILLWSYTLLPTLTWFLFTSLMYLLLPPPRTLSIWGKMYSVFFISFSLSLLLWKIILYYLTLRFGLRLDFWRIGIITAVLTPIITGYSILMYRMGIFRIPFI